MLQNYKLYNCKGVYKAHINPKNILGNVNINKQINGGGGDTSLKIIGNSCNEGDIIVISEFKKGISYIGVVVEIQDVEYKNQKIQNIELYGIWTLLNNVIITSQLIGTINQILTLIINEVNTKLDLSSEFQFKLGQISSDTTSYTIEAESLNAREKIDKLGEITACKYFVANDMSINFDSIDNIPIIALTIDKEIVAIEKESNINDLVNDYILNGTHYINGTSIDTYGYIAKVENDTNVSGATQDTKGNNYLEQYSNPKTLITISTKGTNLSPWYRIKIRNSKIAYPTLNINKIEEKTGGQNITIGEYTGFGKLIVEK